MTARPPLWTWPASIALALVLLAGLAAWVWSADRVVDPPRPLGYYRVDRLRAAFPGEPIAVAFGSSLTRCALQHDSALTDRLRARAPSARFVRMTSNSMTVERSAKLWPAILSARPSVIVIEANLVRFGRLTQREWWTKRWRTKTRDAVRELWRPGAADIVESDENRDGRDGRCTMIRHTRPGAPYRAMLERWRPATDGETDALVGFVRAAERGGARVVILDLPRNPDYARSFPPELMRGGERRLRRLLAQTGATRMAEFPPLPPAVYADAGHLRPEGQRAASAALADRIAPLMRPRS